MQQRLEKNTAQHAVRARLNIAYRYTRTNYNIITAARRGQRCMNIVYRRGRGGEHDIIMLVYYNRLRR